MQEYEVRKLPKKTIWIIVIMIFLGIAVFLGLKTLKEQKMIEVLNSLGYKKINKMQVINKLNVEDKKTRYKSTVYKVKFFDDEAKKTCIGFIQFKKNNKYKEDLDCK